MNLNLLEGICMSSDSVYIRSSLQTNLRLDGFAVGREHSLQNMPGVNMRRAIETSYEPEGMLSRDMGGANRLLEVEGL
jgi:hypothetical protein